MVSDMDHITLHRVDLGTPKKDGELLSLYVGPADLQERLRCLEECERTLKEYKNAEKLGLLQRLPCKLGTRIYEVYTDKYSYNGGKYDHPMLPMCKYNLCSGESNGHRVESPCAFYNGKDDDDFCDCMHDDSRRWNIRSVIFGARIMVELRTIGEYFFLTREEAEAALARLNEKSNDA